MKIKTLTNRFKKKMDTIVYPSFIGVGAEISTGQMISDTNPEIASMHTLIDLTTHFILNTINIESKKFPQIVNRTTDALVHVIGKYGGHHITHALSGNHISCAHNHIDETDIPALVRGQNHIHAIHDHVEHVTTVPYLTIPIAVCICTEQLYKRIKHKQKNQLNG